MSWFSIDRGQHQLQMHTDILYINIHHWIQSNWLLFIIAASA